MTTPHRVVLIVQARMGSTRLPGKSMMDLAGAPLLQRILERLKKCTKVDEMVLATTEKAEDDVLADLANANGVACFRGSEGDLLDRYYQAAKAFRATVVGRFPADNAVPDPVEIDRIIEAHLASDNAFSSNLTTMLDNGYPDGIGAEMIAFDALEQVWRENTDPDQREHVTLNFFDYGTQLAANPMRFKVGTVACPEAFSRPDIVLDVNTQEDYDFMRSLYEALYPRNPDFHITDIIQWFDTVYQGPRKGAA